MIDQYALIKSELELSKKELEERLNRGCRIDRFEEYQSVAGIIEREKNYVLDQHIQDELEDVKRALVKMDFGIYGLCEETGEEIPMHLLTILPTVRTIKEAKAISQFPYTTEFSHYLTTAVR
ncbi:molecular chaperone DnaK [Bacillus sp. Marseille-P3661]|uniref:molecular chaperone DnaK n=1 Tax=Bacillus sp. Marseille-P3661 TaxID=1936234 RepID=UPI000C841CB3|nr:molecular chaperone DnaK [Bacillus sp. Marseille-P3661]